MRVVLIAVLFVLAGCGQLPVSSDYDPGYDFSAITSYAWLPVDPRDSAGDSAQQLATRHIELDSDLSHQRFVEAIDAELQRRGLIKRDRPQPGSVLVLYHRGFEDVQRLQPPTDWQHGYWPYPCYHCYYRPGFYPYPYAGVWGGQHQPWVDRYQRESLVIDLLDPDSKQLIWRGSSQRRMPKLDGPEARAAYIRETVQGIFRQYPPAQTKP